MQHIVKVKSVDKVTYDVVQFGTKKPIQHKFIPQQATEISINKDGWKDKIDLFLMQILSVLTDSFTYVYLHR